MATTFPLRCTMPPEAMALGDLKVVRLALMGANGAEAERSFAAGAVLGPFSVGRQGDWVIDGRGLAPIEGFFYFDGHDLFACSRDAAAPMMVDGRALGADWEALSLGAIVIAGRARIIVEDPSPPPNSASTILTDLDALRAPAVPVRLVTAASKPPKSSAQFASDDEHTRVGEALPGHYDLDDAPTAFLSSSVRDAVKAGLSSAGRNAGPADASRDGSVPLVVRDGRPSTIPPLAHASQGGPFFYGGGAPAESASSLGQPPSLPRLAGAAPLFFGSSSVAGSAPLGGVPSSNAMPTAGRGGGMMRAWREASLVRKATLGLLPLALGAFAFVMLAPVLPSSPAGPAAGLPAGAATPRISKPPEPSTDASSAAPAHDDTPTPRFVAGSRGVATAPDGGVTLERLAVDAVHANKLDDAAKLYRALSAGAAKNQAIDSADAILRTTRPASR